MPVTKPSRIAGASRRKRGAKLSLDEASERLVNVMEKHLGRLAPDKRHAKLQRFLSGPTRGKTSK